MVAINNENSEAELLNVPGIIGFGKASEIAVKRIEK